MVGQTNTFDLFIRLLKGHHGMGCLVLEKLIDLALIPAQCNGEVPRSNADSSDLYVIWKQDELLLRRELEIDCSLDFFSSYSSS